jgi:RimJ/RimL family protein N-acetyltransferase
MRLETERLILREWTPEDLPHFAALNQDIHVSEFFTAPISPADSEAAVRRYQSAHQRDGFCFLAAELKTSGEFIGTIGMQTMSLDIPALPLPKVEIGWRIGYSHWGTGLATEGARAVVDYAFNTVGLSYVAAITAAVNLRSQRVMDKLGMQRRDDLTFHHPGIAAGHMLEKHVVYVLANR